jgi:RTX calcium-binding nonapeptide repeat (4 copies)
VRVRAALIGVLGGALLLAGTASAARFDHVSMFSDTGELVGEGQQRVFTRANARIQVEGDVVHPRVVVPAANADAHSFLLDFDALPGGKLTRGVYDRAQRAAFNKPYRPGLDAIFEVGCNELDGRFEIKDIGVKRRRVVRLWALYEVYCERLPHALFGEVRIGRPAPRGALAPAPRIVRWPATDPGRESTRVPVTVSAREPGTAGAAAVEGPDAQRFAITSDECAGRALAAREVCSVWVRFLPTEPGMRRATLRIGGVRETVVLEGFAHGGRTRLVVQSEPGDPAGGGREWAYTPADSWFGVVGDDATFLKGMVARRAESTDSWQLGFGAPDGGELAAGPFHGARRTSGPPRATPHLDVSGYGHCGGESGGEFTVGDITFHPDGGVKTFGASFEQRCDDASGALRGIFEFRAGDTTPRAPWLKPRPLPRKAKRTGRCALPPFDRARVVRGTEVTDPIVGGDDSEAIFAGAAPDGVQGQGGGDCIDGGPGDDGLGGQAGRDVILGGSGDDAISGGPGPNTIDCGPGIDRATVFRGDRTSRCETVFIDLESP